VICPKRVPHFNPGGTLAEHVLFKINGILIMNYIH